MTQEYIENDLPGKEIRAVLAGISGEGCRSSSQDLATFALSPEESLKELERLAETMGYRVCASVFQEKRVPDAATYMGRGKAEELAAHVESCHASVVIVDGPLTPSQVRNLHEITGVEVINRKELILRIFASRAVTREGKIQVELAARRHELTRLAGHGAEMSNPGGGIGTRGPGEQKIETERRSLRTRIARLNRDLTRIRQVRSQQRKLRRVSGIPLVSLVGYTNAGKSTLFNTLTGDDTLCDDKLFATLDPWVRKWTFAAGEVVLLCDTVGFIQGLPHELVAAFRATLEESLDADLLIHVIDVSSPAWKEQMATTERVLEELGVRDTPRVNCFNKWDLLEEGHGQDLLLDLYRPAICVSAIKGTGLDQLQTMAAAELSRTRQTVTLNIPYASWSLLYEIRQLGTVLEEEHGLNGARVTCRLSPEDIKKYAKILGAGT